jgi:hypothetical protein
MKTNKIIMLLATLAVHPLLAQNLLVNGDFAKGLEGWIDVKPTNPKEPDKVKLEIVSDPAAPAGKAARMTDDDPAGGIGFYQNIPCTPGKTYVISLSAKTSNPAKLGVGYAMVHFYGADGKELGGDSTDNKIRKAIQFPRPGGAVYEVLTDEVTAPAEAVKMRIRCAVLNNATGVADIAEVKVELKKP